MNDVATCMISRLDLELKLCGYRMGISMVPGDFGSEEYLMF
jgi:hypothetical protein